MAHGHAKAFPLRGRWQRKLPDEVSLLPLRRGASVMRRDPSKGKPHSAIAEWVSKGPKALRGRVQRGQSPLWRLIRVEP